MMPTANYCRSHLRLALSLLIILSVFRASGQNAPLPNAFAHNDYWHKRPLYDALDNGYTHIEADIYLRRKKLIVAHVLPIFKTRTLEQLYLEPLMQWYKGTNKNVACGAYPVMLMIDIKSDADKTYASLCAALEKYKPILSTYENGKVTKREVTVVLTGHKPRMLADGTSPRFVFIDEDLARIRQDTLQTAMYQTASCRYSRLVNWEGNGNMPDNVREKLCNYIKTAHLNGEQVRLWDAPEKEKVWAELLKCGVDLINTDKLITLRNFLIKQKNLVGINYIQAAQNVNNTGSVGKL